MHSQGLAAVSFVLVSAAVSFGLSLEEPAQDLSVAEVVSRARKAVVLIRRYDSAGSKKGLGSGFILADGRPVTNAHVVRGASRVEVVDADGQLLMTTSFAEAVSTEVDVAVLPRIVDAPATLSLARSAPAVGERIVVIGAPEGLTNTVTDGILSAVRSIADQQLLQISAPISHGSSGGPVLNLRAQVVGLAVAMLKEGQNLNFAVPVTDVRALMNSPTAKLPFPGVEQGSLVPGQAPPGSKASPESSPRELYSWAYSNFAAGQYDLAIQGFKEYLERYPNTDFTDNAQYWIGECFYGKKQFAEAIEAWNVLFRDYPSSDKLADGRVKKGMALEKIGRPARPS